MKTNPIRRILLTLALVALVLLGMGGTMSAVQAGRSAPQPDDGVLIVAVSPASPAEEAGIVRGDIILTVDGTAVNVVSELAAAITSFAPGETVELTILHGDELLIVNVTLAERNGRAFLGVTPYQAEAQAAATPEIQDQPDAQATPEPEDAPAEPDVSRAIVGGAVVAEVAPGSPAEAAGLQNGDVIVAVDDEPVTGAAGLVAIIRSYRPGDEVRLTVVRADSGATAVRTAVLAEDPRNDRRPFLGVRYQLTPPVAPQASPAGEEAASTHPQDIVDTAVAAGDFTTLAAALEAAGLVETLRGAGPFTVFAPTDAAFAALPDGTVEALLEDPKGDLTDILLYHVVAGEILAADVVGLNGVEVETVGGASITVRIGEDGSVMINDATVIATDVKASNGVIHVIDGVLLPPTPEEAAPADKGATATAVPAEDDAPSAPEATGTPAVEEAAPVDEDVTATAVPAEDSAPSAPEATATPAVEEAAPADKGATATAVPAEDDAPSAPEATATPTPPEAEEPAAPAEAEATPAADEEVAAETAEDDLQDLVDTAVAAADFTTLAAALDAAGLIETLRGQGPFTVFAPTDAAFAALPEGTVESLLADPKGALTDVLLYHVVHGEVLAADVIALDGQEIETVGGAAVTVSVDDEGGVLINDAAVIATDIAAANGVIHVIDAVLIPPADADAAAADATAAPDAAEESAAAEPDATSTPEADEEADASTVGDDGALIGEVLPDSPADEAGLMEGDLIVAVNDEPVTADADLAARIGQYAPGDEVRLSTRTMTDEEVIVLVATLGANPEDEDRAFLGVRYGMLSTLMEQEQEAPAPEATPVPPEEGAAPAAQMGALIVEVVPDSPAASAGLQPGDLIVAVDDVEVDAENDLAALIGQYGPGDEVVLTVLSMLGAEERTVRLDLGENPQDDSRAFLGVRYAPVGVPQMEEFP